MSFLCPPLSCDAFVWIRAGGFRIRWLFLCSADQTDGKRFTKIKTTQIVSVCRAALFCGEAKLVRLLDGSPIGRSVCEGGGLDD